MLKNGETYFKNLAVLTGMFDHFSTLCLKGLRTKCAKQIRKKYEDVYASYSCSFYFCKARECPWRTKMHSPKFG